MFGMPVSHTGLPASVGYRTTTYHPYLTPACAAFHLHSLTIHMLPGLSADGIFTDRNRGCYMHCMSASYGNACRAGSTGAHAYR